MPRYIGIGQYCYANSAAMLLDTIGETVDPALIEALTGVGLGAVLMQRRKLLFSLGAPDSGISRALTMLGFRFVERAGRDGDPPWEALQAELAHGPALLGPLDMGHLAYMPNAAGLGGADHYALAYAMDDEQVFVHDPGGYPYVPIARDALERAWRATRVTYRRGAYRFWCRPERERAVDNAELFTQAVASFEAIYAGAAEWAERERFPIGADAIRAFAKHARGGAITEAERGFMVFFSLALGAKRAHDFARFFAPHQAALAVLKTQQAELFGRAHAAAVAQNWMGLAEALDELADVEESFRATLAETAGVLAGRVA